MGKIIASGKYFGVETTVECYMKNGIPIIEVNGEYGEELQSEFNQLLKKAPPIGGTYYPPENSLLSAYSVLESLFFDENAKVKITIEGDIGKIPIYDDVKDAVY